MKHVIKQSIALCAVVTSLLISACSTKPFESISHETSSQHQEDDVYVCSMHPEITGQKGDKCPKCGMDLTQINQKSSEIIDVKIAHEPKEILEGVKTQLSTTIMKDGKNAALDIVHEKKIHMLIVDEDLTWFDHIHPREQANGSHKVAETFPHGGTYYVYADFKPNGSSATVHKQKLKVTGSVHAVTDTVENKWISHVDGYTATLINGNDFQTNRPQHIGIQIEKNGHSITSHDIEPYLGAVAHVVIIGRKDKEMLHVHPGSNEHVPIHGETHFEKPGIYRMWVQFKVDGIVRTADFTVNVVEGQETNENHHLDHGNHHH